MELDTQATTFAELLKRSGQFNQHTLEQTARRLDVARREAPTEMEAYKLSFLVKVYEQAAQMFPDLSRR